MSKKTHLLPNHDDNMMPTPLEDELLEVDESSVGRRVLCVDEREQLLCNQFFDEPSNKNDTMDGFVSVDSCLGKLK